jgi:mono/diheme cytochrome c family protein
MIRKLLSLTFAIVVAVTLRLGAGGWAVVTVDSLPESVVASKPLRLSFTVRQHGQTLMDGLRPTVTAAAGKDRIASDAQPAGQTGRYVATLSFPRPADWVISVDSGFGVTSRLTLLPLPVVSEAGRAETAQTAAGRGRRLFVAKGCVTCHQNSLESGNTSLGFAPALVARRHDDGHLASILLKPEAVLGRSPQPAGPMPNLGLQPDEVTALVAFINSAGTVTAAAGPR